MSMNNSKMSLKRKKAPNWSPQEINALLDLMIELRVMESYDSNTKTRIEIQKMLSKKLEERGFTRDTEQIRNKFQHLKSEFRCMKINRSSAAGQDAATYDKLTQLLGKQPGYDFQAVEFDSNDDCNNDTQGDTNTEWSTLDEAVFAIKHEPIEQQVDEELEFEELVSPKAKKTRTSYPALVESVTEILKNTIAEQTDKMIEAMKNINEANQQFMQEMQRQNQKFLADLFAKANGVKFEPQCD